MVDTIVVDSYILCKGSCNKNKKKITHLDIRSRQTDGLIENFSCRKNNTSSPSKLRKKKLSIYDNWTGVDHEPKLIDNYGRCKTCSTKAKGKKNK